MTTAEGRTERGHSKEICCGADLFIAMPKARRSPRELTPPGGVSFPAAPRAAAQDRNDAMEAPSRTPEGEASVADFLPRDNAPDHCPISSV